MNWQLALPFLHLFSPEKLTRFLDPKPQAVTGHTMNAFQEEYRRRDRAKSHAVHRAFPTYSHDIALLLLMLRHDRFTEALPLLQRLTGVDYPSHPGLWEIWWFSDDPRARKWRSELATAFWH